MMRKYINYWGMLGTALGVCLISAGDEPWFACFTVMVVSGVAYMLTDGD